MLQLISGIEAIIIPETDGSRIIKNEFERFDKTFLSMIETDKKITRSEYLQVYDLKEKVSSFKIFSYRNKLLKNMCLTQHQIIYFVETHKKWLPISEKNKILFLSKNNENYCIIGIKKDNQNYYALYYDFVSFWDVNTRIVMPIY